MPFYGGETLVARLGRAPPVGLEEGVRIGSRLAKGVAALHRAGIVHRDAEPEGVILPRDGGQRLLDFGVVRLPGVDEAAPGTPSYRAPEPPAGAPGDDRSDLYALGVGPYRVFTGAEPYGEVEPFQRPVFGCARAAGPAPPGPAGLAGPRRHARRVGAAGGAAGRRGGTGLGAGHEGRAPAAPEQALAGSRPGAVLARGVAGAVGAARLVGAAAAVRGRASGAPRPVAVAAPRGPFRAFRGLVRRNRRTIPGRVAVVPA